MIKLLNGHSLTEKARFQPETMPLNLSERQSTATMTIGPDAPEITVGEWLQDMDEPGAGIVWRVKTVDTQYETNTRTLQLEHVINTLRDKLMFGEVKPQDMGGTAAGCTAAQAISYILNQQSDWVLGTCGYSVTNPYNFNGDDLFSALETVSSSLSGCWWSYDMSVYPFVLNIAPRASVVSTELRMARNISTARMTIDRSRMYTRLYPIGKNNLHIDEVYVSRNENLYGVICKTETDQSKGTKEELKRWAEERIANHCEPSVTVTISALDLSNETGENLDQIVLGAICRMPLPGYNTTIEEIITKISYQDKISEPTRATVTLANMLEDVASIINQLIKSGGGGGRAAAKNDEEKHAWIIEENDHIALLAEGVAGEGAARDWSRVAELLVDGNGIHQRVTQAQHDIIDAYSLIDQTTTAIRLEIANVQSGVQSFIEMTPEMIHSEVSTAVSGIAQSVIEQTATYIRTEVENAASAISESVIEQTAEYVRTEVESVASGVAWSVIEQTMTNIQQQIARKSKVYIQWTDPNDGVNELFEGDVWIKRNNNRTWNEANAAHEKWNQTGVAWRSKYGDLQYVWKNNAWVLVKDFAADVENEVKLEQTATSLALVGHAVDTQGQEFNSQLIVTARAIRSEVSTAQSQVYSVIEQTSTNIKTLVANEIAGVQSSIDQEADRIGLVVAGTGANAHIKPAEIVASINNGSSSIKLSAEHIDIEGVVTQLGAYDIGCGSLQVEGFAEFYRTVEIGQGIAFDDGAGMSIGDGAMRVGNYNVSWKSLSFVRVTSVSPSHRFLYAGNTGLTPSNALLSNVVTSYQNTTIHYLGR